MSDKIETWENGILHEIRTFNSFDGTGKIVVEKWVMLRPQLETFDIPHKERAMINEIPLIPQGIAVCVYPTRELMLSYLAWEKTDEAPPFVSSRPVVPMTPVERWEHTSVFDRKFNVTPMSVK